MDRLVDRLAATSDEEEREVIYAHLGALDDLVLTPDDGLLIFRELHLRQPWQRHLRRSGHLYWAVSAAGAHAYAGSGDTTTVRLTGKLVPDDWEAVCESILDLHHVGEDELRLDAGTEIELVGINVDGKDVAHPLLGSTLVA